LQSVLDEEQNYRIDHYLGKETVQNIFSFRFGNTIFEPLFHRNYVDHVQITVAETDGVEGRGEFYDKTGAIRDVLQNHCLQLMCVVAMEPPSGFTADCVRDEKLKVLSSVVLPDEDPKRWISRGQYTEDRTTSGYLAEEGVAEESTTETFVGLRLTIDNWRWAGVPFFIRTGKRLKSKVTEIALRFKQPPTDFFKKLGIPLPAANVLVFRIQPNEAILLSFNAKPPGMSFRIQPVDLDFHYEETFRSAIPEAYERLILDAMRGDSTLFTRADEIEEAWRIVTEITRRWHGDQPPDPYRPNTWGPASADRLFDDAPGCHGGWRKPDTKD
jgi:glucose-6-phosphate 1-dehydrogenase